MLLCLGSGSCHRSTWGCTTQASLLVASHGLLGTESGSGARAVSSFILMCNVVSQAEAEVTVAEAEEHSLSSHAWWMAPLCHLVWHRLSDHLKTSHQLMCPLLSQKQQGRTAVVQTTRRLSLSLFPPAAPGRSPPAPEIKALGPLAPGWPWQDRLMVPGAFPSRQPDGSNESAAGGLVKGIPPL